MLTAMLAIAGCGVLEEGSECVPNADVVGVAVPDSVVDVALARAVLRVGQAVDVCMLGSDGCTWIDQRFEFQSDAPTVARLEMNASVVSDACNELHSTNIYASGIVRTGRMIAVGPGTAHVQAALLRGSRVEKTAGLIWCPRFGPGAFREDCRPLVVEVTP
jgi:hypothetical protein